MDTCHLLLGRPWQYDRRVSHDGFKNTYSLSKIEAPLKPEAKDSKVIGISFITGSHEEIYTLLVVNADAT